MYTIRIFVSILLLLPAILGFSQSQDEFFFKQANAFFAKHVVNGKVDYANLKASPNMLNALVRTVEGYELTSRSANEQKAFFINAYNLLVVKGLVEAYPVSSPQDVSLFFDKKAYVVAGRKVSLNELEKQWLFK
ncbi:MAG: DUF547 domain-containing protein, partial [Bacteroidota bacterium]